MDYPLAHVLLKTKSQYLTLQPAYIRHGIEEIRTD